MSFSILRRTATTKAVLDEQQYGPVFIMQSLLESPSMKATLALMAEIWGTVLVGSTQKVIPLVVLQKHLQ